ncbi:MAG TPA: Plug domain-containing protein [Gemmatimonadales bacterium]|nr:Plug domain-containing protein [Gemmatimonadales bacterium]
MPAAAVLLTAHCLLLTPAAAQVPDTLPAEAETREVPDTTLADSLTRRIQDSIRARPDSSKLQRYLAAQALERARVPVPDRILLPGPQPALTRVVLTRDSMDWAHATTLADLLQRVPGVYLWRGGWIGQPEYPNYQARGPTSVEYLLDGFPYLAAGSDSLGVDPALVALSLLDRVEIERWPGLLRVHLFTLQHDRVAARSRIGVARGSRDFARYQGSLEKRSHSGIGFALAADNLSVPTAEEIRTKFENTWILAQGSWIPSPQRGIVLQHLRSRPDRDPVLVPGSDTLSRGFAEARRSEWQLRGFWRADTTGLGPRLDLLVGRTRASDSLVAAQEIWQVGAVGSLRRPTLSLGGSAFWRSRWTSIDVRATAAWMPGAALTLSGEAAYQRHDGGRQSRWLGLRGGVALPLGLQATASARFGEAVAAPAVATDSARTLRDWQVLAGWRRPWLEVEGGYTRTAAFAPFSYQPYAAIPVIEPSSAATEWITARARLTPISWLTLDGWYSNPAKGTIEGLPPRHALAAGTIRTRFQRIFPSGVLDVQLRLAVEHWSDGVLGRDAFGDPVRVEQATFLRSLVQVALGSFQFYWDRVNLTLTDAAYVPGLPIVGRPSEFGVRWSFSN